MEEPKRYSIKIVKSKMRGNDQEKIVENKTLEELIEYFSYTLSIVNFGRDNSQDPKTIKSFVSKLQKGYDKKEARCYDRTFVELI
ncbi:hypothetical protein [Leptospira phage LE4]|uniref:Uncharacterized protein n=1 Tax=Leptospira phage LE4 TaxID=2041383 RepID=A0A343LEI1_9CAUD|nr:hypothetical protein HWB34_gp78 [Leptospira phage LE4]ATN95091.1 hypothetical protein [Leptospira phage LE4]